MNNHFSVWLVPETSDKEYLEEIIKQLADKYSSPLFVPHLTLLPDANIKLDELKIAIKQIFKDTKAFKVNVEGINQSEAFFKTVFIEIKLKEILKNLFIGYSQNKFGAILSTFKPHISLIYKILPKNEKLSIISGLNIKNEFVIGSIYIVAPKEGEEDFHDVHNWRIVYKKSFITS